MWYIRIQKYLFLEVEQMLNAKLYSLLYVVITKGSKEVTKGVFVLSTGKVYFSFCSLRLNWNV